ncbi:MAG: murein biosynthesis integral membrane protein MurJ [Caldisericia bacterium]|nr:murein biosynthesis integral membrane protein MurJ [Caldisericia bacterium]
MNIRSLFRNAGIVTFGALCSRILGLARETAITNRFGLSAQTDAYAVGSYVPITLSNMLVSGIVSAVFIPLFSQLVAKKKIADLRLIITVTINQFVLVMVVFLVLLYGIAPFMVKLQAPRFDPERLYYGISIFRIALPSILFLGLAALSSGILNSIKIFGIPTLGGIIFNATIVVITLVFSRQWGINAVAIALVVGAAGQFLIQYIWVEKHHLGYRFKPILYHPAMKELYILILPVLIGSGINYLAPLVNNMIGSQLAQGYLASLHTAFKVSQFPIGIFALAVSSVVFPNLAEHVEKKEHCNVQENVQWAIKFVLLIMLPATLGLVATSVPVVRLLFESGEFTVKDTLITSPALQMYCVALIPWSLTAILVKILYSCKDTITPVWVAVVTIAVLVVVDLALVGPMGHIGLALGSAISGVFNTVVLWIIIAKRYPSYLIVSPLKKTGFICTIGSLLMMASLYIVHMYLQHFLTMSSKLHQMLQVFFLVAVGCIVYGVFIYVFDKRDVKEVMGRS